MPGRELRVARGPWAEWPWELGGSLDPKPGLCPTLHTSSLAYLLGPPRTCLFARPPLGVSWSPWSCWADLGWTLPHSDRPES